jgi:hypothetical protein
MAGGHDPGCAPSYGRAILKSTPARTTQPAATWPKKAVLDDRVALSEWLSHTPPELVAAHLNLDKATLDVIPREETITMPE